MPVDLYLVMFWTSGRSGGSGFAIRIGSARYFDGRDKDFT